ncbi:MAG: hypothetical protein FWB93_04790 [Oscillospiraceae bacterium]|nr:hypothetical protein [Oscillospiraceae bacterium]
MNRKAKIAVCLSLAALMFISVFGMVSFGASEQVRAPITESENSETKPPKAEQPAEPQVNVEENTEKKPSILDRILGRDNDEQAPVEPEQPAEDTVATAAVSDCYDGYCDDGDGIISRATVNRNTRAAGNRVHREGAYNRGGMDRAYRADNRRVNHGRVVDGAVGDRPGIIGDEGRHLRNKEGRSLENSAGRIGRGVERGVNRAENAVERVFDRDNTRANVTRSNTRTTAERTTGTMWAVIIGLVIAAAVITLLAVLIPRRRHNATTNRNNRHY